jgi:hypothetical protein
VTDTGEQLEETGAETGQQLEQTGADTGQQLEETATDTGEQLEETGADTGEQLEETGADTGEQLEDPLSDLVAQVRPDEEPMKGAPVGYMNEPAMLLVTDKRVLWRSIEPGSPVLSMNFGDIHEVKVDGGDGVTLTYRPADNPDQLDAEFVFRHGSEDVRDLVLGRARREVEIRAAGATLASGLGYLAGVRKGEQYEVDVEAREAGLVMYLGALPMWSCSYAAAAWFAVDPVPDGLTASERLGVGSPAIWLALAGEGVEDRWRLVVKADDVLRWRVILEHFGVRETTES